MSNPATRAPSRKETPRTPWVSRPMGRASFSLRRIAFRPVLAEVGCDPGAAEHALAAPTLGTIGGGRYPLGVAAMGERDHHVFLAHQVFFAELYRPLQVYLCPAGVPVFLLQLGKVFLDQQQDLGLVGEEVLVVGDPLDHLLVLFLDLAPLEAGS